MFFLYMTLLNILPYFLQITTVKKYQLLVYFIFPSFFWNVGIYIIWIFLFMFYLEHKDTPIFEDYINDTLKDDRNQRTTNYSHRNNWLFPCKPRTKNIRHYHHSIFWKNMKIRKAYILARHFHNMEDDSAGIFYTEEGGGVDWLWDVI